MLLLFTLPTALVLLANAVNKKQVAPSNVVDSRPVVFEPAEAVRPRPELMAPPLMPVQSPAEDAKLRAIERRLQETENALAEQEARERAAKTQQMLDKLAAEQEARNLAARQTAAAQLAKAVQNQRVRAIVLISRDGSTLLLSDGTYWSVVNAPDREAMVGLRSDTTITTREGTFVVLNSEPRVSITVKLHNNSEMHLSYNSLLIFVSPRS